MNLYHIIKAIQNRKFQCHSEYHSSLFWFLDETRIMLDFGLPCYAFMCFTSDVTLFPRQHLQFHSINYRQFTVEYSQHDNRYLNLKHYSMYD